MQVLTPMTLYDANGRGVTVYAPSTLAPNPQNNGNPGPNQPMPPPAPQSSYPAAIGLPTAGSYGGWLHGPGPGFGAGGYTLAPFPQTQGPNPGMQFQAPQQFPQHQQQPQEQQMLYQTPQLFPAAYYSQPPHPPPLYHPAPPPPNAPQSPSAPYGASAPPQGPAPHMAPYYPPPPPTPYPSPPPDIIPKQASISPPAPLPPPPAPYPAGAANPYTPSTSLPESPTTTPAPLAPRLPPAQGQRVKSATNVYVSNLPESITKEGLEDIFSAHGRVLSCRVARKQGQCPIGFVQYTDPGMALAAVAAANGLVVEDGRAIRVKLADHDKDRGVVSSPSPDLYICNLPPSWTYAELHEAFSAYGKILSLTTFKDTDGGGASGSGMVRYATTAEAMAALQALNRLQVSSLDRPLEVKYAESRAEKDRRIATRVDSEDLPQAPEAPRATVGDKPPKELTPMQQFTRLMNAYSTDEQTDLVQLTNSIQSKSECGRSTDSSEGIAPSDNSSQFSAPIQAYRAPGKAAPPVPSFWDSVQGMLYVDPEGAITNNESLSGPQGAGMAPIGVLEAPGADGAFGDDATAAGHRAWRSKRKQRR